CAESVAALDVRGGAEEHDGGARFAVIGWKQWTDLLKLPEFSDVDFGGSEDLPWRGIQAKRWLGTLWIPHSGLTLDTGVRHCYWYHKSAVGHAVGKDVKTDITWHGDRASNFVNN